MSAHVFPWCVECIPISFFYSICVYISSHLPEVYSEMYCNCKVVNILICYITVQGRGPTIEDQQLTPENVPVLVQKCLKFIEDHGIFIILLILGVMAHNL